MRVVITGGQGFLGSQLVYQFESLKHTVFVPQRRFFNLTLQHNAAAVFEIFPEPDLVVHCAARVGGIGANRRLPAAFLEDNLRINTNTVVEARRAGVRKFVAIGSVCGYPSIPSKIPFVEEDFLGDYPELTNAPYGYTKRVLLLQLMAEHAQYGLDWAFVIPTNMYGPGDNFDRSTSHVIPGIIQAVHMAKMNGESLVRLWGTGTPTRDFLYISDAVRAIYAVATTRTYTRTPLNIGTGEETSISDLAHYIALLMDYEGEIEWDASLPDGQERRVLNCDRIEEVLGWTPTVNLHNGLIQTIHYWRDQCASS